MSNFIQRSITGFFFVLVIVGAIVYNAYTFAGLFFLITLLGCWEFFRLTRCDGVYPHRILGTLSGGVLFLTSFFSLNQTLKTEWFILVLLLLQIAFIAELYTKHCDPFKNLAFTVLGLIYVAVPFALLNLIVLDRHTGLLYRGNWLLGYFFILWANDTGAYLFGRWLGKHKLFERISPKKTWEGSAGGLLLALVIAFICALYFKDISMLNWFIIATIIVITGTLGDLVESMFKRSINIKDSGSILPGHGGILDRFDGLLISVPFVVAYMLLVGII